VRRTACTSRRPRSATRWHACARFSAIRCSCETAARSWRRHGRGSSHRRSQARSIASATFSKRGATSALPNARGRSHSRPPITSASCRLSLSGSPECCPRASLRVVTLDHAVANDGLASGDVDVLLGLPPNPPPEIRSEPAYTDRLMCAVWKKHAPTGRRFTLERFLKARHVAVALQGKHAIDYVDGVLSRLGHTRSVVLSVPQFSLAASCVVGTPYVTMLPGSMAKQLVSSLPIAVYKPPFELPAITILQLWHMRTDADPASMFFRSIVRQVGGKGRA
jgi:hypothetical protein